MKYGLTISKAIETLGSLQVPSELINSVEIAEAIRMGIESLNKQIELGQLLQEFKDDMHPENRYSEAVVIEFLADAYILSGVNNIDS